MIFEDDDWTVYDALADPAAGRELLHAMRSNAEFQSGQDEFIFRWAENAGAGLGGTVDVRPVGVEQSNSSIVFGDQLILKAFRKVEPGVNPELELLRFLSARGFPHIAPLAGWYEVEGRHISATLGILQEFLAGARDGWDLALDELTSDPERPARPDPRARRRDRRAAHVRSAPTTRTRRSRPTSRPPRRSRSSPPTSTSRSSASSSTCPRRTASRRSAAAARTCARSSTRSRTSPRRPRDPHPRRPAPRPDDAHRARLGGARLRGRAGAAAARAAAEALAAARRGRDAALVLVRDGGREAAARRRGAPDGWEERARERFLEGYHSAVDGSLLPPGQQATEQLLAVFELEKAVYELRYELNNRPDWVAIPVAGILRLLEDT